MACYWLHQHESKVTIPRVEETNSIIFYKIQVNIADVQWDVAHRYSEFYELHNILVLDHGVSKDALPAKKVFGNKSPEFIESRRVALEEYLQNMLKYLTRTMPQVFIQFLHLHLYDVFFLLQHMAAAYYIKGDAILSSNRMQMFNPLELHAIGICLKFPFPKITDSDKAYDISNVMEVCSQLKSLQLDGKENHLSSNICPNKLEIDLTPFKALEVFIVKKYNFDNITELGNIRSTVKVLTVRFTDIRSISQVLQCDNVHKGSITDGQTWAAITKLDLSSNQLTNIDESIKLLPKIETLILNDNKIKEIENLSSLSSLRHLFVSNNLISSIEGMNTKIGNVLTLNLSQNLIGRIQDLGKLYSLETLVLSSNRISDVNDVACIGDLPCLENFTLTGNPVSTIIDYRIKVLKHFGERARELCLDNEKPLQPEIDKALVLRALQIGKEGKFISSIPK
ncbi:nischarin [Atheta coriaria]|uniref:nischarin n=1 Tax=Dalotia coriaria TaxID=877792 RepID=UPI0031F3F367